MRTYDKHEGIKFFCRILAAFFTPIIFGWGTLFLLWLFLR